MLILDQKNLNLKRLINIQKCHSSTKFDHCAIKGRQKKLTYSNEFWKLPQLWTKVRKFRTEYGLLWGHCYELFVCGDLDWISRNTWRDIHRIWIFYHLKNIILHDYQVTELTAIELKWNYFQEPICMYGQFSPLKKSLQNEKDSD